MRYLLCLCAVICFSVTNACVTREDCHLHGDCVNGQCRCDQEWTGMSCSTPFCRFGTILSNGECHCQWGQTLKNGVCIRQCSHGNMSFVTGKCECLPDWETAGITDTIDFIKGSCSQFQCKSDEQCRERLPNVPDATCPVRGWNCDCGFLHADYSNQRAGCMNIMYVLNIKILRVYRYVCLEVFWLVGLIGMVLSIPFGQYRRWCNCRHSWWNRFQMCIGYRVVQCEGQCLRNRRCRFRDEFALSIWWFKVTLWFYAFASAIVVLIAFLWSFILWVIVALILCAIAILGCLAACKDGGGDCSDGCTGCDDGCCCCCGNQASTNSWSSGNTTQNTNILIVGGPYPYGYGYGYGYDPCCYCGEDHSHTTRSNTSTNASSTQSSCCCCFYPIVWLIHTYPSFPENLHGGILGYCMGTHVLRNTYTGGNCFIDCMSLSWMRPVHDVSNVDGWLDTVREHVLHTNTNSSHDRSPHRLYMERATPSAPPMVSNSNYSTPLKVSDHLKNAYSPRDDVSRHTSIEEFALPTEHTDPYMHIPIITHHNTIPTSMTIYNRVHVTENECLICNEAPTSWVVWSCGHVVCKTCTDSMFQQGSTCAMCRLLPQNAHVYQVELIQ